MSRKEIPAKIIITCDICKKTNERDSNVSWKKKAHLTLKKNALDFVGDAVADGTIEFDLCDNCEKEVDHMLKNLQSNNS